MYTVGYVCKLSSNKSTVINGEANKIKTELFNDIHEDSGSHLGQTMSSVSIQPKLATAGFTGTNGTGTPSNTQNNSE